MQKASDTRSLKHNKILIICGPTASGKTNLALLLAHTFDGELVNADSRQMYEGLDVLSGKDLPKGAQLTLHDSIRVKETELFVRSYDYNGTPIWLYDVAPASVSLSISHFQAMAAHVICDIQARGKLPIVVGGNGFYLSSLTKIIPTISVPQDMNVRAELEGKTVVELQTFIASADPGRWNAMNNSDKNNPRRLVRAIEVARWKKNRGIDNDQVKNRVFDACWVGLRVDLKVLEERITARVHERFEGGAVEEAAACGEVASSLPISTTLGLAILQRYVRGEMTADEAKKAWVREEFQYAKRQAVWFARQTAISWFDRESHDYANMVEKLVREWYT